MKINMQMKSYCNTVILSVIILLTSCNESINNMLNDNYPNPNDSISNRYNKVLYISIDDLPGRVVKDLIDKNRLPQLSALLRKSIYSFNSISEAEEGSEFTKENGLANLMTGVTSSKHRINTSYSTYDKENYPSILQRFHEENTDGKSSFFTTKESDAVAFVANNSQVKVSNTAKELEQDILTYLSTTEDQIVILSLSSLSTLLATNGGDYSGESYLNEIVTYDILLGKLKTVLDSRKNGKDEDWLIMLSSTNGGQQGGTIATLYDDESRNTFTMVYNSKFSTQYYARPTENVTYVDSAVRFVGAQSRGALADPSKYNFGSYGNYTVQLLINAGTTHANYPSILSKRHQIFDESSGWTIFGAGGNWEFRSANWNFKAGGMIKDGNWHVLTVVFDGNNREIRLYQDGIKSASGEMRATNVDNNAPLSIGQIGTDYNSANSQYVLNNVQIYNRAFSDTDVQSVYCQTNITNTHPFYNNLIGYWKGNEFGKISLKESLGSGNDFKLTGPFVWDTFSVVSENLCPPVNASYYRNVLNSVDFPFMMFSWLGIPIQRDWKWEGRAVALPFDVLTK